MSFIGSTDRTRGMTSKLFSGGGDGVNHSSVFAFHGSGPAITPVLSDRTTLTTVSMMPTASSHDPTEEIALKVDHPDAVVYSYTRRGIPSRPAECWIRKVR